MVIFYFASLEVGGESVTHGCVGGVGVSRVGAAAMGDAGLYTALLQVRSWSDNADPRVVDYYGGT